MTYPTTEFFEGLSRQATVPSLAKVTGTVRFDIADGGLMRAWRVAINGGRLGVSVGGGDADCVITAERRLFDGIATGEVNAMAALLRGELAVAGDPELLVAVQRLFPEKASARARQSAV